MGFFRSAFGQRVCCFGRFNSFSDVNDFCRLNSASIQGYTNNSKSGVRTHSAAVCHERSDYPPHLSITLYYYNLFHIFP